MILRGVGEPQARIGGKGPASRTLLVGGGGET